jgi:S1-C subfamily serine protease
LTSQLAGYFGVKEGKGVLVTQVEPDSPASKAGLKAGDCIVKAGSTEIASASDLVNALNGAKDSEIALSIVRAGHEQNLSAKLEPAANPMQDRMFQRQLERQSRAIRRQLPRLEQMQRQWGRLTTGEV